MQKIILLSIVASIGLIGLAFFVTTSFPQNPAEPSLENNESSSENTEQPQGESERLLAGNLSAEEKAILSPPSSNASDSAKDEHTRLVLSVAKETGRIALEDCTVSPLVLRIKRGESFVVTNFDRVSHALFISSANQYSLDPDQTKEIVADFGGGGIYGYGCDSSTKAIGMILLTED